MVIEEYQDEDEYHVLESTSKPVTLAEMEKKMISDSLDKFRGKRKLAAKELNIKDEYTGKNLEVASNILAKKDIIVEQNEYTKEKVEALKFESFENGWAECEKAQQKLIDRTKEDSSISLMMKIESNLFNIYETIQIFNFLKKE